MSQPEKQVAPTPFLPDQALVRLPDVERYSGLKRATIYRWVAHGRFPRPVKLGTRNVAWTWLAIRTWLEAQSRVPPTVPPTS